MIKFGRSKSEDSVGLDIGSYSIKVVAVKKESGTTKLTAYNIKRIPLEDKGVKKDALIREMLDEIDFHPEVVNVSVSGPDVIVRFINLPKMSKDQLAKALVFEAEKHIPFNVSEVVLDFIILGDALEPGQMRVLLAAAKRELVEKLVKIAGDLNLTINVIDNNPFAMFNAFLESHPPLEDEGIAFLDLGHSQTDILVSTGNQPCFTRQIQIGGRDINKMLCQELSISPEKAEEFKMGLGDPDTEIVGHATASVLDDMIKEMQLSFGYFENRYNKSIGRVYCSGGMINQEGVIEYLSDKLGIAVEKWNPVEGLALSENLSKQDVDSIASQLAVSIGLALRG